MRLKVLLVQPVREGDNIQISPDLGLLLLGTALSRQGFNVTRLGGEMLAIRHAIRASIRNFKKLVRRKSPGDRIPLYVGEAKI